MTEDPPRTWSFLTNHGQVLLSIAHNPAIRLREIGAVVGITERAAHRIVTELAQAGYISRQRVGRRNRYTIEPDLPLPDPLARERSIGDLLALLEQRREERVGGSRVAQ
jgi:DNA-binding Lrp family transcriptional regulator